MRLWVTMLVVACALATSACARVPACFDRSGMLPDERKVLTAITHGQAGRDLAAAVFAGDTDTVRRMLTADPQLRSTHVPPAVYPNFAPDGQWGDLLTFAVAKCDGTMVDLLLQLGVPANGAIPGSPLNLALQSNDLAFAERLLDAGASPDPDPSRFSAPLLTAAEQSSPDAAELLLARGADPNRRDSIGITTLQSVVDGDSMRVAEMLIRHGGDAWALNPGGGLPVQGIAQKLILTSPAEEAARQRLLTQVRRTDRPWPPPSPADVRQAVAEERWPLGDTPTAIVKGIKEHSAKDRARRPN